MAELEESGIHVAKECGKNTVQFKVGLDKTVFTFDKDLICKTASFFKAAFDGSFKEGEQQSMEMPEDDPKIFKYFLCWVQTGYVLVEEDAEEDAEEEELETFDIIRLYCFAEAYGIPDLQNTTIGYLLDRVALSNRIPNELISYIYENTSENSPLQGLMVDLSAYSKNLHARNRGEYASRDGFFCETNGRIEYPNEFLRDLVQKLFTLKADDPATALLGGSFYLAKYHIKIPDDSAQSDTASDIGSITKVDAEVRTDQ